MGWGNTGSSWQYARWVNLIARNSRITEPIGAELAAVKVFIKAIWNPQTQTGTRNWLETAFNKKSVTAAASNYQGDVDSEPTCVLIELLSTIGRNLDNIPITDALLAAQSAYIMLGTGPKFGGIGGSVVTIP